MPETSSGVDIRSGLLFPFPFLLLGGGFILAGIGIFGGHPLVSFVLIPVGLFIVTSYEGTEIDLHARTYREYSSYLFFKKGATRTFDCIEKIYINPVRVSRRMYTAHTTSSSIFDNTEYRAYVKFCGGEKVLLFGGSSRKKIVRKSKEIASTLRTSLQDNTLTLKNE